VKGATVWGDKRKIFYLPTMTLLQAEGTSKEKKLDET